MIGILVAYLVICPLSYWVGMDLRQAQEIFFQISAMALILSSLATGKGVKWNKDHIPILALVGWYGICYLLNNFMGYNVLLNLFLGVGVYLSVCNGVTEKQVNTVIKTMLWIAGFAIAYLALQYAFNYDLRGFCALRRPDLAAKCSIFGLEAFFGIYIALVVPFMLVTGGWLGLLLIPVVAFGKSFSCMIAAPAMLLFYDWFKHRVRFWIIFIPLMMGIVAYTYTCEIESNMHKTRFDMWGKVVQDCFKRPLGYGLDAFRNDRRIGSIKYFKNTWDDKTVRVRVSKEGWLLEGKPSKEFIDKIKEGRTDKDAHPIDMWDDPHCLPLSIFHATGLIGIGIFLYLITTVWRRFLRCNYNQMAVASMASLMGLMIISVTQFPFNVARTAHLIPVIAGIFYISTEGNAD